MGCCSGKRGGVLWLRLTPTHRSLPFPRAGPAELQKCALTALLVPFIISMAWLRPLLEVQAPSPRLLQQLWLPRRTEGTGDTCAHPRKTSVQAVASGQEGKSHCAWNLGTESPLTSPLLALAAWPCPTQERLWPRLGQLWVNGASAASPCGPLSTTGTPWHRRRSLAPPSPLGTAPQVPGGTQAQEMGFDAASVAEHASLLLWGDVTWAPAGETMNKASHHRSPITGQNSGAVAQPFSKASGPAAEPWLLQPLAGAAVRAPVAVPGSGDCSPRASMAAGGVQGTAHPRRSVESTRCTVLSVRLLPTVAADPH